MYKVLEVLLGFKNVLVSLGMSWRDLTGWLVSAGLGQSWHILAGLNGSQQVSVGLVGSCHISVFVILSLQILTGPGWFLAGQQV